MKKITWVNFLHFYQPPHQNPALLKIVVRESYRFLLNFFKKNPNLRLTVNISGSLTELLEQHGHHKIIQGFKELALREQIELVGSAKYHPILPLLPEEEIKRQIELNNNINQTYFGNAYNPKGFFCPEMAYNDKVGRVLKKMGFKWIILDEIAFNGKLNEIDYNKKYLDRENGLYIIFRNRNISKSFVPEFIYKNKEKMSKVVITATDAEMYGHHHKEPKKYLNKIILDENIVTLPISIFLKQLKEEEKIMPMPSSWESTEKDLHAGMPFAMWSDPNNDFHKMLWELTNMAINFNNEYNIDDHDEWARRHLNRGLASCTWWWMAERKIDVFSPWAWSPDEIAKGAEEIIRSIRSLGDLPTEKKLQAEKLYQKFMGDVWEKHWRINKNIK